MTYYIGGEINTAASLGTDNPRYFYGLRRTESGSVYFTKVDQLTGEDQITINIDGTAENNWENFEWGVDFYEGRLKADHSRPYPNLYFDQYRWDQRNLYYYINNAGQLVVRTGQPYNYS